MIKEIPQQYKTSHMIQWFKKFHNKIKLEMLLLVQTSFFQLDQFQKPVRKNIYQNVQYYQHIHWWMLDFIIQ